jgi:Zn-dependent peptidase ImmA (M78 family)/transcriptional regulator with XRE-family HTH domain
MSTTNKSRLGQRLKSIRERLALTQQEVAQHLGFSSYQIVSYIESGKRELKASELVKLLRLYHKDISDIFPPEGEEVTEAAVLWRSKENDRKAGELEERFLTLCRNYDLLEKKVGETLENRFEPWKVSPAGLSFRTVQNRAEQICEKLDLGIRPAASLPKILEEQLYFKIIYLDLRGAGSAASTVGDFGPAVLLGTRSAPWRRNYDLAHEFFHILTWHTYKPEEVHCGEDGDEKSQADRYADAFASALLLPREVFMTEVKKRLKDKRISRLDLVQLAMDFEVSTEAVLWRMVRLGFLDTGRVKEVIESPDFRKLDKTLRRGTYSRTLDFSRRLVYLAFKAMMLRRISRARLAEIFHTPLGLLDDFLTQYGLSEEEYYNFEFTTA